LTSGHSSIRTLKTTVSRKVPFSRFMSRRNDVPTSVPARPSSLSVTSRIAYAVRPPARPSASP
jgi:hypothetical protein